MGLATLGVTSLLLVPFATVLYLWHVNRAIKAPHPEAVALSPHRWTDKDIQIAAEHVSSQPPNTLAHLPPATGRRYIVIGGSGFVGGWVVRHLIGRGENYKNIRIIDIRPPTRKDLLKGDISKVPFVQADVTNLDSLDAAFAVAWPASDGQRKNGITVIHTVAGIRFYERHPFFLPRSSVLNVDGTRNALAASKKNGAEIFLFVSSASIGVTPTSFWIWPWQRKPQSLVQVVKDESQPEVDFRSQDNFFSNYAYSKYLAEKLVLSADSPNEGFCTGSLRPGNAIFGSGGDLNAGAYLVRGENPSWVAPMIQSFTYVENVSYGILLYEARLLEISDRSQLSGQSFFICDKGDPIAYSDLYHTLNLLTSGKARFPQLPASPMLVLAYLIEYYYLLQARYLPFLPRLSGDLVNLQPSIFDLVTIHLKIDDSRARSPLAAGGLGYQPLWTTLEGLCQLVKDHLDSGGVSTVDHQISSGGIGFGRKGRTEGLAVSRAAANTALKRT